VEIKTLIKITEPSPVKKPTVKNPFLKGQPVRFPSFTDSSTFNPSVILSSVFDDINDAHINPGFNRMDVINILIIIHLFKTKSSWKSCIKKKGYGMRQ